MRDFNRFMELLNTKEITYDSIEKALNLLADSLCIGKIEISSVDNKRSLFYVFSDAFSKEIKRYISNDYVYSFFGNKEDIKYSDEDLGDIDLLLRLVSIYHANVLLTKKAEEAEYISMNTKLPNIHGFKKLLTDARNNNFDFSKYNSYFINIRGFGLINKVFGTEQGDFAIKGFAKSLNQFKEENEIIAHLGGDNFVGLIKKERHDSFIDLVNQCPVTLLKDNEVVLISLTGVVGYYEIGNINCIDSIISNAAMACQYARTTRKKVVKHTEELSNMVNSIKTIESTFKEELKKGNFLVYYQPKFDIKTGRIIGVETLSRWVCNGRIIPPGMFVPALEKNGEIIDLDLYVLEHLCMDIHNYRNLGHKIVPASCNLSRSDFVDEKLEEKVINIIKKYNVRNEDIVIEVTETTNLEENERLARFISEMHKNGIMTSIDDFGTGYSSLSVLRDFKVNEIKIDRSFINRNTLSDSDEIILGSIIKMAKDLNISVICEGVETQEQADFLVKLGCNNAQGFLYSKPVTKLEFEAMLERDRKEKNKKENSV